MHAHLQHLHADRAEHVAAGLRELLSIEEVRRLRLCRAEHGWRLPFVDLKADEKVWEGVRRCGRA